MSKSKSIRMVLLSDNRIDAGVPSGIQACAVLEEWRERRRREKEDDGLAEQRNVQGAREWLLI